MDNDRQRWQLRVPRRDLRGSTPEETRRNVLASEERVKGYNWGICASVAVACTVALELIGALPGWGFIMWPVFVVGATVTVVCFIGMVAHVVRSYDILVSRDTVPPPSDGAQPNVGALGRGRRHSALSRRQRRIAPARQPRS